MSTQQEFKGTPDLREVDENRLDKRQKLLVHLPEVKEQSTP